MKAKYSRIAYRTQAKDNKSIFLSLDYYAVGIQYVYHTNQGFHLLL
jgi:hypothetical protein